MQEGGVLTRDGRMSKVSQHVSR